jgi:hypothetical protein
MTNAQTTDRHGKEARAANIGPRRQAAGHGNRVASRGHTTGSCSGWIWRPALVATHSISPLLVRGAGSVSSA